MARELNQALLLAATIDAEGNFNLAGASDGAGRPDARVAFCIRGDGTLCRLDDGLAPRRTQTGVARTLLDAVRKDTHADADMSLFAECLAHTLGEQTPPLFRLAPESKGRSSRFSLDSTEDDARRLQLVHDAYNIYLVLYEERLV